MKDKERLLNLLISKTPKEINDIIESKGKKPKMHKAFIEVKR